MPKERRKTSHHAPSAKLPAARHFAVQDNAVQSLPDIPADLTANEVLEKLSAKDGLSQLPLIKKKEKQQLKHELFLERLELTRAPYSKSHTRRLKRKEKQSLSVNLNDMQTALDNIQSTTDLDVPITSASSKDKDASLAAATGHRTQHLSAKQRRRVLDAERTRQSAIINNPNFVKNPFALIRTHVESALEKSS